MLEQDYKYLKRILIISQKADPSPPLGTVLGNLGVNTTAFCKEFNSFTKELPDYFLLKVFIKIYDNRSIKFSVKLPTTGYILNLLKIEQDMTKKVHERLHVYKL
jgi:large subunit ribosomal protein L11